jgi:hypothetical protein
MNFGDPRRGIRQAFRLGALLWTAANCLEAAEPTTRLVLLRSFPASTRRVTQEGVEMTLSPVDPGIAWNELVVSWNVAPQSRVTVSARTVSDSGQSPWYILGKWSSDPSKGPRTSVNGQNDAEARVATDSLLVKVRRPRVEVRLAFPSSADADGLRLIALSFADSARTSPPRPAKRAAWGRRIEVPLRSQTLYPEGIQSWCSPTSLSMVLAHWGRRLGRPDLDHTVPEVAAAVHDPGWPGTGNWPFNTAYAGSFTGLNSCVTRLEGLGEVEEWIAAGSPVIASVDATQLDERRSGSAPSGHLVVVRGFSDHGDVEILDPGVSPERGARTVARAAFERAWRYSLRTVYLVWPQEESRGAAPANRGSGGPASR